MARQPDIQYIRFYTDGSAARKVEPRIPMQTARLPKVRRRKRVVLHVDPLAVAGLVMAVVMLVLIAAGVMQLKAAQEQTVSMEQYVSELRMDNAALQEAYDTGYDLAEVERQALALGMVPKAQVQHIRIPVAAEEVQEQQLSFWERIYAFLTGSLA